MKFNILGVTLARGGSKSIKDKNIKKIKNKPLIYHTIKEAKKSHKLTNFIVSTDTKKIASISKKFGADVPFLRPKNFSRDASTSAEALKHALINAEKFYKKKFHYVVELMCTNPLKTSKDIDNIIDIMIKNKANSVIAVNKLFDHHPARIKKIVKNRLCDFGIKEKLESRRQDLKPDAFIRAGSIYAMSRNYVLKKIRYKSKVSIPYVLPQSRSVNIDSLNDFILAEIKMNEKR